MQTTQNPHDGWKACRGGEIARLVGQLKQRRQRAKQRDAVVAGALLLVVLVGGYWLLGLSRPSDSVHAGIACRNVVQHAEEYLAGELDPETTEQIRQHLAECPFCKEKVEAMRLNSDGDPGSNPEATRNNAEVSGSPVVRGPVELEPVLSAVSG